MTIVGRVRMVSLLLSGLAISLSLVSPAQAAPKCFGRVATIVGTRQADVLRGTGAVDVIVSKGGNDRVYGGGGADLICTGKGNDRIFGRGGRDRVSAGGGADRIKGHGNYSRDDAEVLKGGPGNDVIRAGAGVIDVTRGGPGDDRLFGEAQGDTIYGGSGNDYIDTGGTDEAATGDTVLAGLGDDEIVSLDWGPDVLKGQEGNDTLLGAANSRDEMHGGAGDDRMEGGLVFFEDAPQGVTVDLTAGTATGEGLDLIIDPEGVSGSDFADVLVGSEASEFLWGGPGDDSIDGLGGHDQISFGTGVDQVSGGAGDDTLLDADYECADASLCGSQPDDTFDGGDGVDEIHYEGAIGVTVDVAAGTATGLGADTFSNIEDVTGTEHDDRLLGDEGPNALDASTGTDYLDGRGGDDVLRAGSALFDAEQGDEFYGGSGDDVLSAFRGSSTLHGGPGSDDLWAHAGRHALHGDEGDDVLLSYDGRHTLDGGAGSDTADYSRLGEAHVDLASGVAQKPHRSDPTEFGTDSLMSIENATGSDGNDVLLGNEESNVLQGGLGNDDIRGLGGDDFLDGGQGMAQGVSAAENDVLDGGAGTDACVNGETNTNCET